MFKLQYKDSAKQGLKQQVKARVSETSLGYSVYIEQNGEPLTTQIDFTYDEYGMYTDTQSAAEEYAASFNRVWVIVEMALAQVAKDAAG